MCKLTVGELAAHTHTRGTMNITGKARMYSEYNKKNYSVKNVYQGAFYWTDALENSDDAYSTSTNLASGNRDAIRNIPFDASRSWTGATSSVGSNSKHNQIPTYISAHFYKRLS